jgi:hypothetical protein
MAVGCDAAVSGSAFEPSAAFLSPEPSFVDLGEIGSLAPVETAVLVRNEGKNSILIEKAVGSCGCTAARIEPVRLEPGKATEIGVRFDPRGRHGPQHQHVEVFFNGRSDPLRVPVTAVVVEALALKEKVIRFDGVFGESGHRRALEIFSLDSQPFEILKIETPDAIAARVLIPFDGQTGVTTVEFAPAPELPIGSYTGNVVLTTTHPLQSEIHWPIVVNVESTLYADPPLLVFDRSRGVDGDGDRAGSATFLVRRRDGLPFEIRKIESEHTAFDFEIEPRSAGAKAIVARAARPVDALSNDSIRIYGDKEKGEFAEVRLRFID